MLRRVSEFLLLNVHEEARRPVRDGDKWEKGGQKSDTSKQAPTRKTEAAVDRRQNKRRLRQCPSGIAQRPPHHAIAVPAAMQNSHKDNVRSSAGGKQLKQKKSSSPSVAQHHLPPLDLLWASFFRESPSHLPPLDLFWASFFLRVQLTSLLLISPGLCLEYK